MPEELDDSQWWLDDNVWLDLFNPTFHEDSSKADRTALQSSGIAYLRKSKAAQKALHVWRGALKMRFG